MILAGGTGSRLNPLTKVTNKHLLPVGRYPMIFHPIAKLKEAGLEEILIVTGVEHLEDIVGLLESGDQWGLEFTYRVQQEAGGIAQALGLAQKFSMHEDLVVVLGDNIFKDDLTPYVESFKNQDSGGRIMLKEVEEPQRFGVPAFDGQRITNIVEKPADPPSQYCVTGIYMYDSQVFDFIPTLVPSEQEELEITDVNNLYIEQAQLQYDVFDSWWTDAGTFSSLQRANELARGVTYDLFE